MDCKTLPNLFEKNSFKWYAKADIPFEELKGAMTTATVLALVDFNKPFIAETDTCSKGIRSVLM